MADIFKPVTNKDVEERRSKMRWSMDIRVIGLSEENARKLQYDQGIKDLIMNKYGGFVDVTVIFNNGRYGD
jgi:hypothetical protein